MANWWKDGLVYIKCEIDGGSAEYSYLLGHSMYWDEMVFNVAMAFI